MAVVAESPRKDLHENSEIVVEEVAKVTEEVKLESRPDTALEVKEPIAVKIVKEPAVEIIKEPIAVEIIKEPIAVEIIKEEIDVEIIKEPIAVEPKESKEIKVKLPKLVAQRSSAKSEISSDSSESEDENSAIEMVKDALKDAIKEARDVLAAELGVDDTKKRKPLTSSPKKSNWEVLADVIYQKKYYRTNRTSSMESLLEDEEDCQINLSKMYASPNPVSPSPSEMPESPIIFEVLDKNDTHALSDISEESMSFTHETI